RSSASKSVDSVPSVPVLSVPSVPVLSVSSVPVLSVSSVRVLFAAFVSALSVASVSVAAHPQPTFRAGIDLVRLDVRVTDRDGRPIRDLRQDEFEVVQDGRRRPVLFFRHVEEPVEPLADIVRRTVAGEVSTNQGAARGHLYVL